MSVETGIKMSTIEKLLSSELNLVQFDNPKLIATKPMPTLSTQTKQVLPMV